MTAPHTPQRIQRKRTRGWRMPPGAVCVSRPSRWGNPYEIGRDGTRAQVIAAYRKHLRLHPELIAAARRDLRGKDLACWCALDEPCHGDVLLDIANAPEVPAS